MPKLPIVSGNDLVKAFVKLDKDYHQTGSHIIVRHKNPPHRRLTIPNLREISKGTLRAIIRQAGLTREEFFNILD